MNSPKPQVYYHGCNHEGDGYSSVSLSIDGTRHTYTLTNQQADTVEFLCRKVSALRAFNFAKRHARTTMATM